LLALAILALLGLGLGAAALALLLAGLFLGLAGGGLLDLARLGGGEGAQAALHLGFGNPGRAPNGAGRSRDAGCAGAGGGGLGHRLHHTLALGLDHDALGAAMRE